MITRLSVRNFKSLRELEVELGRLTVIVGPNGCGKSSVLQAIEALRDLLIVNGGSSFPGQTLSQPSTSGMNAPETIEYRLDFELRCAVRATIKPVARNQSGVLVRESPIVIEADDGEHEYRSLQDVPDNILGMLLGIKLYQLDKGVMEAPSFSADPSPVLGARGENLASVLDAMQGERREHFEAIEAALCAFIPGLRRLRLRRVQHVGAGLQLMGHQVVLDFEFAKSIVAEQASEGTILLLGLLTVIGVEPGPPMTVMLDDLDRGLHPKAQKQLVAHLHQLLDDRPELQILATTHSPYLVEHLDYGEVLAMTQSLEDGRSLVAPLAEHPDAERWREEMSAGEFWSSVGEDWLRQATR